MNEQTRDDITQFVKIQPSSEWNLRHVEVVVETALELSQHYPDADRDVIEAAAWLHDVGHNKKPVKENEHHLRAKEIAEPFLIRVSFPREKIPAVLHCVESHRTRKPPNPSTIEAKIVASADNLSHFKDFQWLLRVISREKALAKLERNLNAPFMIPEAKQQAEEILEQIDPSER